jgi:hypothetical protein
LTANYTPSRLILINIDALRPDIFEQALLDNAIPNIARLLGGPKAERGLILQPASTAPSITFCSQASIITGAHPKDHGVTGNQFFDRFGSISGNPRHYAFDGGGHRLALDDALNVFRNGLADQALSSEVETFYEIGRRHGLKSTVVFHMYARGAETWIKPGLEDWREFFSFGESFGISSEKYDRRMLDDTIRHLREGNRPDILHLYFWGLDHDSHVHGPLIQYPYLTDTIDPLVGQLTEELERQEMLDGALFVLFSDHGQIDVPDQPEYCLQLAFPPLDIGLGHVFKAIKRDVLNVPRETGMDTVLSMNGALSHIYVRRKIGWWKQPARFDKDVLPVAEAFWEGATTGKHYSPLYNSLSMILVRDVEHEGWAAPFRAYTPRGCVPIAEFLGERPAIHALDGVNRLDHLAGPNSGDLLLVSNIDDGYYFAYPYRGIHGSLHPEDSKSMLTFSLPSGTPEEAAAVLARAQAAMAARCKRENDRMLNIADIHTGVMAAMGWGK